MNLAEYSTYDATGLAQLVREGKVTPKELVDLAIEGIEKVNPHVHAVWQVLKKEAYAQIDAGLPDGEFTGVPFLLKEILAHAKDVTTNFGSKFGEGISFPVDSELIADLKKAGAVLVGTTATPEWGYNATTEAIVKGEPTKNAFNPEHSSGGSSGGSATCVTAGVVPFAHGNDGGGSIRIPSSCSGVVGLKPTRGRVSAAPYNSEPLAGNGIEFVLTKTIRDTAAFLDILSEEKPGEYCYAPRLLKFASYKEAIQEPVRKLKIAYSYKTPTGFEPTEEVKAKLAETVEMLKGLGHELVEDTFEIDADEWMDAVNNIWAAAVAEMIVAVADMKGVQPTTEDIEATMWKVYQTGINLPAVQYKQAVNVQAKVSRQVGAFFENYDVVLSPTMSSEPVKLGVLDANDPEKSAKRLTVQMLGEVAPYTAIYNGTGQPAISLPLHRSANGLPIGMQFAGHYGDEATLLQLSKQIEETVKWSEFEKPMIHVSKDI